MSSLEPGGVGREDGDWLCRARGVPRCRRPSRRCHPHRPSAGLTSTQAGPRDGNGNEPPEADVGSPGVQHADAGLETRVWPSDPIETGD